MTAASKCLKAEDYACALELFVEEMKTEKRGMFSPGTAEPSLLGARVEFTVGMASNSVTPERIRDVTNFLIGSVVTDHADTPYYLFELHAVRSIACEQIRDEACQTESRAFVCANKERLATPLLAKRVEAAKKNLEERVLRVFSECEDT
ncbi:MAG: hypothetical protein AAF401_16180 [Pseudomonadota bacterium]